MALENETEIRQSMLADQTGDPSERVDGCALAHLTEGVDGAALWSERTGSVERSTHRRLDPLTGGRRRNVLRAIMAPQRAKMGDLDSALQVWEEIVDQGRRSGMCRRHQMQCI